MIKKYLIAILSVWLLFILQCSVFSKINIGGIVPNLLIIITACWGFMQGSTFGLVVGFICGALLDVFYGSFLGFYALLYMYIGYINGKLEVYFLDDDIKLPIISIIVSDFVYGFACYVFLFLLRGRFDFGYYLGHVIFPELIITVIFAVVVYPLIVLIYRKFLVEKR